MIEVSPMMTLPAFVIGFIVLSLVARALAEYIVYRQTKSSSNRSNDRTSSNKAIQRYYNTYRKGA